MASISAAQVLEAGSWNFVLEWIQVGRSIYKVWSYIELHVMSEVSILMNCKPSTWVGLLNKYLIYRRVHCTVAVSTHGEYFTHGGEDVLILSLLEGDDLDI